MVTMAQQVVRNQFKMIRRNALIEGIEQGLEQSQKLGEINKEREIAKKLKQENMSLEFISKITGLSIEEIEKL